MNSNNIFAIIFLISGFLLVLVLVFLNPISLLIDILMIFGFLLITLGFLKLFFTINKEINKEV